MPCLEIDSPSRGRKLDQRLCWTNLVPCLEIDSPSRGRKRKKQAYYVKRTASDSLEIDSPSRGRKQ